MMLAKLSCDHAEGVDSGLRAWELHVGGWERASGIVLADAVVYTGMMNMGPTFLRNNLQLGTYADSAALRTALLPWCQIIPRTLEHGTGAHDDNRMLVDSLKKGFWLKPFLARNPICDLFVVVEFVFVCVCLCRDPSDCLPCWCCLCCTGSRNCGPGWAAMVSKTQRRGSWIPGEERAEKVLPDTITIDGRKEWICKFCSESNVWTRWRCRRCCYNIPAGLRGKHQQVIAVRKGKWSTGSPSSRGEEDKKSKIQEAEIKELRAQIEQLRKQQRGEAGQEGQSDPARRESGLEEDWSMD